MKKIILMIPIIFMTLLWFILIYNFIYFVRKELKTHQIKDTIILYLNDNKIKNCE